MRSSVHRVAARPIARRRLLLVAPALLLPLARPASGPQVLGSFAQSAAELRARAGVLAGDLQHAVTSPSRERLGRAVLDTLGEAADVVAVSVLDRRTGARGHHRGDVPVPRASTAKILVVAAAMAHARDLGRGLTRQEHEHARLAITESDNEVTDALYLQAGGHDAVARIARRIGLACPLTPVEHWSRTRGTADELVVLLRSLTSARTPLVPDDTATLLAHLGDVMDGQRWGVGTVASRSVRVRVKNGWMTLDPTPKRPWQVNSVGDVRGGGRDYVLAIAQQAQRTQFEGFELASRIGRAVHAALREPMR
jgi:hypothetical protein